MEQHECARILRSKRTHYLNHVNYHQYSWKYQQRIWEELRPLKMRKIDYGTSDAPFIITRKKVLRMELAEICATYNTMNSQNNSNNII